MSERVYFDEDLKKNADEHLEAVFRQLYEWNVEGKQGEAIRIMLDEYTAVLFGGAQVLFRDAINCVDSAAKWSLQFGELRIIPLTAQDLAWLQSSENALGVEVNYGAKIGTDQSKQQRVYGKTIHQVVLLAGVQVLREVAYKLLNNKTGATPH